MRERGEVIVRVRKLAEDRAALSAAAAASAAGAARVAAELARQRSRQHPLGERSGGIAAAELAAAAGTGAALRETAAVAARHEVLASGQALEASAVMRDARAAREAAERFLERRRDAARLELARKLQRQADESAVSNWKSA